MRLPTTVRSLERAVVEWPLWHMSEANLVSLVLQYRCVGWDRGSGIFSSCVRRFLSHPEIYNFRM
jgi:hypothetical protein